MSVPRSLRWLAVAVLLAAAIGLAGYWWSQPQTPVITQLPILNSDDPAAIAIYDGIIRMIVASRQQHSDKPIRVEVFNTTCHGFNVDPFKDILDDNEIRRALITPSQPLDEMHFPSARDYHFFSGDRWDLGNLTISLGNIVANDDGSYEVLLVSNWVTSVGYRRYRATRTTFGDWQFEEVSSSTGLWQPMWQ